MQVTNIGAQEMLIYLKKLIVFKMFMSTKVIWSQLLWLESKTTWINQKISR